MGFIPDSPSFDTTVNISETSSSAISSVRDVHIVLVSTYLFGSADFSLVHEESQDIEFQRIFA